MNRMLHAWLLLAAIPVATRTAHAQGTDSAAMPGVTTGHYACRSSLTPSATSRGAVDAAASRAVDTSFVLSIADRTWSRESYDGGVALGTNSRADAASRWSACAGAAVHLGQASVTLHEVRGAIHLRIDPSALAGQPAARVTPDSTSIPRSTTPAVPPRR